MSTTRWGLILVSLAGISAHADFNLQEPLTALPRGSTLKMKGAKAPRFIPGKTEVLLGTYDVDTDGDGVQDFKDWCPETPAGKTVWTTKDIDEKKCKAVHVGCAGTAGEVALYKPGNAYSYPSGYQVSCQLLTLPSSDDRVLPLTTELKVLDRSDASISPEEKEKIGTTKVYVPYLRETAQRDVLMVSTPGGTHFGVNCSSRTWTSKASSENQVMYDSSDYSTGSSIEQAQKYFDITIPPPVEITRVH